MLRPLYSRPARAFRALHVVGSPTTLRHALEARAWEAGADGIMAATNIAGHADRLGSCELLAEAMGLRPAVRTAAGAA